ncbi:MAG: AAA family ATPase [Saprospiraceae bacterium]|nr:ATP-binding protein [Saprospiraceae bacterium]MDW8229816.1 AAA family ATPase [Saprospiraceae bacterium]
MQHYPIGKQEFEVIRRNGFVYVDKTRWVYQLAARTSQYFLSRPRRFGKSLFLSTLKSLFSGDRSLFKDLWIEPYLAEIEQRPVLHISFNDISHRTLGLENALRKAMQDIARERQLKLSNMGAYDTHFLEIITQMAAERPIVLLIDEYDKPIIDYLNDVPQAVANRDILKSLFSVLKGAEIHIHLLFITGVSKFSKVSIFSDLNHLQDISMEDAYATMLGFTAEEVHTYFAQRIQQIAQQHQLDENALWEKIRLHYNGYSWDGKNYVYNPFSLLSFLQSGAFNNYWFETGTPTFLVEYVRRQRPPEAIEGTVVNKGIFNRFDFENLDVIAAMFQTGYLTIQKAEGSGMDAWLTLGYPNAEVRYSFEQHLLSHFAAQPPTSVSHQLYALRKALDHLDPDAFVAHLKTFFAAIPFDAAPPNSRPPQTWEGFFQALTFLLLRALGLDVQAEVASAKGRSDAVVRLPGSIWVMEFKLGSAQSALRQIQRQGYAEPYLHAGKPLILLGLGFDANARNVKNHKWVRIG